MSKRAVVTLGDKVRAARTQKNLSQLELAQKAGVRPEVVSRIETGKSPGSLGSLYKLAPHLGLTIDELAPQTPTAAVKKTAKKAKKGT
jgi:transcriptional regulator with XRE-family HTH domain